MITPFWFLVVSLSAYRVTWFFILDKLIGTDLDSDSKFSDRLYLWNERNNASDHPNWLKTKIYQLVICPFCLGFWISLAATCIALREYPWNLGTEGWFIAWAVSAASLLFFQLTKRLMRP